MNLNNMENIREKIEQYKVIEKEIKQLCYELSNQYSAYCKEKGVSLWIYDFSGKKIEDLNFSFDWDTFDIGYSEFRCGDEDRFYTSFTEEELINPDLIKKKIDDKAEENRLTELRREMYSKQSKERSEQRERELYLELKKKYGE